MNLQEKLAWFFSLKSVRYAQIFVVVTGDLLALANLYPKHCMYIRRPFLVWEEIPHDMDEEDDNVTESN